MCCLPCGGWRRGRGDRLAALGPVLLRLERAFWRAVIDRMYEGMTLQEAIEEMNLDAILNNDDGNGARLKMDEKANGAASEPSRVAPREKEER